MGEFRASRKQPGLIGGESALDIVGVFEQRLREFGAVEHRKIGAFPGKGRHQMCGIADQRNARRPRPAMVWWQRVDRSQRRPGIVALQQRGQRRRPAGEMSRDLRPPRAGIGKIDRTNPFLGLVQGDVAAQGAIGISMRDDPLARCDRINVPVPIAAALSGKRAAPLCRMISTKQVPE
jgi:hypothetical protein